jgi:DNA-binding NtrC family response regulator
MTARATVLVVDDEPDMLEVFTAFLAREHRVIIALDVGRALPVLEDAGCDLVITDIRMPGPSGLVLIDTVHRLRPGMPVLVVSGCDRDDGIDVFRWIPKPFRRDELLAAVRDALASR